ncbi:MAG TPA: hypothetical protein PKK66_03305 [Bacteroidales bacterium]|jgi:hypothetical protein|nr:hypothetical protein [Bacteroidales bacterium]HNW67857.1 hypothetical protein [Bacteroidales bacterium]HPT51891.1 hypothetical protein [Bacteroidales bacterium]
MKNIKTYLIGIYLVFGCIILFSACKKTCICSVTRTTMTTCDSNSYELGGKLTEDDCLLYNDTIQDGEGVVRVISCKLN